MPRAKAAKVENVEDGGGVPDLDSWGPAMLALPADERQFVVGMYAFHGNATKSAREAGIGVEESEGALRVMAHRLAHSPRITAAMVELGRAVLQVHSPRMVRNLVDLALKSKNAEVRRKASANLLDRAGLSAVIQVKHEHEHVLTFDEKLSELQRLARLNGDDPAVAIAGLVPPKASVTDAEYEESGK